MKNLNIMMTIKANNTKEAESIVTRELAELAKCIARHNGSFMIGGKCDVTEVANGNYKATANMEITEYPSLNDTIYTMQALWMTKSEILKSAVFVSESEAPKEKEEQKAKPKHTCNICGVGLDDDDYAIVNEDTESEYNVCYDCLDNMSGIVWCDTCDCYVDGLIENPVTQRETLCPHCGDNLDC